MGVLNITPDSFYSGSRFSNTDEVLKKTEEFLSQGASILDVGAYSSRPEAVHISEQEEADRLLTAINKILREFPEAIISVDTFRANIAKIAVQNGASIVNDISAGNMDTKMFETVASLQVPYIMMHMKGTPQNMQDNPTYQNITSEVLTYFKEKTQQLERLGVKEIVIDPGFGFAKTLVHNYELLQKMEILQELNYPILTGFSRKSMIYKALNTTPQEALNGTTVLNTIGLMKGANILRVHDVKEAMECIKLVSLVG